MVRAWERGYVIVKIVLLTIRVTYSHMMTTLCTENCCHRSPTGRVSVWLKWSMVGVLTCMYWVGCAFECNVKTPEKSPSPSFEDPLWLPCPWAYKQVGSEYELAVKKCLVCTLLVNLYSLFTIQSQPTLPKYVRKTTPIAPTGRAQTALKDCFHSQPVLANQC